MREIEIDKDEWKQVIDDDMVNTILSVYVYVSVLCGCVWHSFSALVLVSVKHIVNHPYQHCPGLPEGLFLRPGGHRPPGRVTLTIRGGPALLCFSDVYALFLSLSLFSSQSLYTLSFLASSKVYAKQLMV